VGLPAHYLTPELYLRFERQSEFRHEYFEGQMILMAGGTPRHSLVILNVSGAVWRLLPEGGPCRAFNNDLRTSVHWDNLITYPDFQVVCGEIEYAESDRNTILNPTFVVEVLSPSTAKHDRGKKLEYYKGCPSIREYLLIEPAPVEIEHGWRLENGGWSMETVRERNGSIRLESLGMDLPAADIYRGVEGVRA
jgi:Uma2 family endonuclease